MSGPKSCGWAEVPLGRFTTLQRGYDITKAEQADGPYPVISSSGLKSRHAHFMVRGPGVIIGRKGTLGTAFYVDEDYWPHDTTLWVKDFHGNNPRFAYYLLKSLGLERYDCGASNPTLNRNHIHGLPVIVPPLGTQERIASIFSAYDDLIENNTRRIAILEEMARALYQEWFVHFRFPGHEHVPLVDSPLGPIPEGWEMLQLAEIAGFARGRSYKSSELVEDGGVPFINLKCIDRDGGFRNEGLKRYQGQFKPQQVVSKGDIVMAVTDMTQERRIVAQSGRVPALGGSMGVISMDTIKIAPRENVDREFLYATLRWSRFPDEIKHHANGANVLHLNPKHVLAYWLAIPPRELMAGYGRVVVENLGLIDLLLQKNDKLRATRDLLLPKLVSGEIDVSAISEEPVAEAAD